MAMDTRFVPLSTSVFSAALLVVACSGSAVEQPGDPATDSKSTTGQTTVIIGGGVSSGSGGSTVSGSAGAPSVGTDAFGAAGGAAVELPTFDCSDPAFFPLRIDNQGNPIDYEQDELEQGELGAGGGANSVGNGDLTVLLVFDKSGSMASYWGGKTRWQAGSDAVLLGLDGILDQITLGGLFFPFDEEAAVPGCGVPPITMRPQIDFTTGRGFKESWIAGACAAQPDGSTPLEHALEVADEAIASAQERGLVKERMRVLLVTDGEPTCEDDLEAIVAFPAQWLEKGIETLVIGLPGSEPAHDLLDAIAQAGGTEKQSSPAMIGEFEDEVYNALR